MHRGVLIVLILSTIVSAFSTTYAFNTTLESISDLIRVEGDFSFSKVIPGQEYVQNFTVRWAVPPESLARLGGDKVAVNVLASAPEGSWVRFRREDRLYRAYAFSLECRVQKSSCGEGSILTQTVETSVLVPENASTKRESVLFTASLTESYQSQLASSDLFSTLEQLRENVVPQMRKTVENVLSSPTTAPAQTTGQTRRESTTPSPALAQSKPVEQQTVKSIFEEPFLKPFTGFFSGASKDILFVIGIFAILGTLWLLNKLFPEKSKGLEGA